MEGGYFAGGFSLLAFRPDGYYCGVLLTPVGRCFAVLKLSPVALSAVREGVERGRTRPEMAWFTSVSLLAPRSFQGAVQGVIHCGGSSADAFCLLFFF